MLDRSPKWKAVGNYIHALEDSYSHQRGLTERDFGTTYNHGIEKVLGHAVSRHETDWIWRRKVLAYKMSKDVYYALNDLCRATKATCSAAKWSDLEDSIWRFIEYDPSEHGEMTKGLMFGTSVAITNVRTYASKVHMLRWQGINVEVNGRDAFDRENSHQEYLRFKHAQEAAGQDK